MNQLLLYPTILCNQSRGGARFTKISQLSPLRKKVLFPHRWESANSLVVSCQPMNSRLNQDKTEFSILILAISLQMFSHSNRLPLAVSKRARDPSEGSKIKRSKGNYLLDEVVQIFWDFRGKAT